MSRPTKGPWHVQNGYGFDSRPATLVVDLTGHLVAGTGHVTKESQANARLIAAAPDLLAVVEELEESASYWSEYDVPLGIVDRLRAALAKARGGS